MRRASLKRVKARSPRKRARRGSVLLLAVGRMGSALIKGWLAAKTFTAIHVVEPAPSAALKSLARKRSITLRASLPAMLPPVAAIVLAIKPQVLKGEDALLRTLGDTSALVL